MPLVVIPLGLLVGLALGALGGGGSVLTVPALVQVLGVEPAVATTSSLVIVGITALLSLPAHHRAGRVRLGQGLIFGMLGTAGSLAGSTAARSVPPAVLMTAFAALMVLVATLMLRRAAGSQTATRDITHPEPMLTLRPLTCACPRVLQLLAAATVVGLLTGFLGVGGGFVLVPVLVLVLGFTMPVAVGTSLLVVAVNSATALAARVHQGAGDLPWGLVLAFAAVAVVGSLVGSRVADRVPAGRLSQAFAVLVLVVAAITAVQSVPELLV